MATSVGGLEVDLAANIAAFRADMGKASAVLNSEAAKMNRSLGAIDRGMANLNASVAAGAAKLGSMALKIGAAAIGFTSLRGAVAGTINTFRDMQGEADRLGVSIDKGVAEAAKNAVLQWDRLKLSMKEGIAGFLFSTADELDAKIKELEDKQAAGEHIDPRELSALRNKRVAMWPNQTSPSGNTQTALQTGGFVERLPSGIEGVAHSPNPFIAGTFIDSSERIDTDPVHEAFLQRQADMDEFLDQIKAQQDALAKAEAAWDQWSGKISDSITDAILKTHKLGDGLRAIAIELIRAGISKFVVGGILNAAGSYFGVAGARAAGGGVTAGESYLVGERGAELFTPSASGTISPNSQSGGRGGNTFNIDARGASVQAVARLERMVVGLAAATPSIAVNAVARAQSRSGRRGR